MHAHSGISQQHQQTRLPTSPLSLKRRILSDHLQHLHDTISQVGV